MGSVVAALLRHGWGVPARQVHLHAREGLAARRAAAVALLHWSV